MAGSDPITIDWSPLEGAGGDAAALPALFQGLQTSNPLEYMEIFTALVQNLVVKNTRAVAAPVALPYLYALLESREQLLYRSYLLQIVGCMALGQTDDYVPQGFDNAGGAASEQRQAYAAVEATLPRVYQFLTDRGIAVRAMAAYLLAFFPSAREKSGEALLAMVEREVHAETQCTAVVAVAMLYRGVEAAAERGAVCVQLEQRCAGALARGEGEVETEVAQYALALARCIVGVHATADVKEVTRTLTVPPYLLTPHLNNVPRMSEKSGESELPFADPTIAMLTARVLAQLPGPGPQPTATVFHLAEKISKTHAEYLEHMVNAALHSAWGSTATGANAVPDPWPAYADLDDRQGAVVRALAALHHNDFRPLRNVLEAWRLPTTLKGIKAYMAGKPTAVEKRSRGCLSCFG